MRTRDLEPEHVWMAAWVEDIAGQHGQVEAIERIAAAMPERVGEDLLSLQWLIRGFLKACELAESLAEDFLSQRFVSSQAMTRALLEGAATLAWVMDEPTEDEQLVRVHRCLRTSYEERLKKGHALPKREQAFLDGARSAGLKERPDVRGMLDMLDRAEQGRGGTAYWATHYQQFGLSSDFLHDSFMGVGVFAVDEEAGMMHIDLNPDVRVGLVALRWCAFYLVRCLDAVLRFAGLDQEADDLAERYATFKGGSAPRRWTPSPTERCRIGAVPGSVRSPDNSASVPSGVASTALLRCMESGSPGSPRVGVLALVRRRRRREHLCRGQPGGSRCRA